MLSTDVSILTSGSAARMRMEEYARRFDTLRIILLAPSEKTHVVSVYESFHIHVCGDGRMRAFLGALAFRQSSPVTVVTAQDPFELGYLGYVLARRFKAALQLQVHTDLLSPFFAAESFRRMMQVALAKHLLPKADCIRVVSKRIAESVLRANVKIKTKPVVLPIAVDVEKYGSAQGKDFLRKKYPQFKKFILFVGRLEKEKNPCVAVDVLPEILKTHGDVALVFVGEGSEHQLLVERAQRLGVSGSVFFEGAVSDVRPYYHGADLLLVTSQYEGYGLALVEALASGLQVLSFDVGVAREAGAQITDREHLAKDAVLLLSGASRAVLNRSVVLDSEQAVSGFVESVKFCARQK